MTNGQAPDFIADRGFSQPPITEPTLIAASDERSFAGTSPPCLADAALYHECSQWRDATGRSRTAAPPITFPLNAEGWHAISIGVYPFWSDAEGRQLELQLKLSGPDPFTVLSYPRVPFGGHVERLHEMFWDVADLTGRDLVIGQPTARASPGDGPGSFLGQPARIAYVKLTPLTAAEVRAVVADRARSDTRRLFAHQDAHGPHSAGG